MGLEDFTADDSTDSESIKTRKKLKNVTLEKEFWTDLIVSAPTYAILAAEYSEESSAKAIIKEMDRVVNEDLEEYSVEPEQEEFIQGLRDDFVENNL